MSKTHKVIELFNNIFLQELLHKLNEVGSSTCVHSAVVSIPMFQHNVKRENADILIQLHMTSESIVLSKLDIRCTLPHYAVHYDDNRLAIAIKNAFGQIYCKLLNVPLNCMIVEATNKLSINWYVKHMTTDTTDIDNDSYYIDFKSIYGLGAVVYTSIDTLKKFPGNRLKLITDISQSKGYIYTSMTIKEIKQLYDDVYTSNR